MSVANRFALSCVLSLLLIVLSAPVRADGFGGTTIAQPQDEKILDEKFTDPCQAHDGPGDPISPYNGREFLRRTDVLVKGLFPIVIERRYNSQSTYDSPLGYGWALNHDRRLYEYADGSVALRYRCGRRDRFVFSGGAYVRPNGGLYGGLVQNGDGTFTYTNHNLVKDFYDTEGRLTASQDPRGNRLEYLYDARGKLPLTGTSPYAVDPNQPMTVAYVHRLIRVEERTADGNLTGNAVDLTYDETAGRLTSITSNDGRQVTYVHDQTAGPTQGNLIQVNGLENIVSTYQYQDPDDAHNLTSIQEGAGTTPHINVYDEQDRVIRQDYGNRSIDFDYAVDFTKTIVTKTITDDVGNVLHTPVTVYHYNSQGYPEKIVDALGNETQFNYNNQGFLVRIEIWEKQGITLNLLQAVDYTYDTSGNRLSETIVLDSGETVTKSWTYDHNRIASKQVVSSLDPGKIFRTEFTFYRDADGAPTNIETIRRRKDDGTFQIKSFAYDTLGRLTTVTLPDGHQLVGEYAGLYLTRVYRQIGASQSPFLQRQFAHDAHGNRNLIVDARNNATRVEYDDRGRVTKITNALGQATLVDYTDNKLTRLEIGRTASEGEGQVIRLNYNSENRLTSLERKAEAGDFVPYERYTYDSDGNRLTATDAEGRTWQFRHDILGRVQNAIDPLNQVTTLTNDAAGNRTSVIDPLNRITNYVYDQLNRLILIEEHGVTPKQITQLTYGAANNLTGVTDARNHTTTYEHDALSRVVKVIQSLGQTVQYSYDGRDRLISIINARGQKILNGYEPWGPVRTNAHYPSVTATTPERTISYTYDSMGNVQSVSDDGIQSNTLYTFTYDPLNRLSRTTVGYLPRGTTILDYAYDRFGNRRQLIVNDDGNLAHDYVYNKLNQLKVAALPKGQSFIFDYYATDQLRNITYPSGVSTDFVYRLDNLLQRVSVSGNSGQIGQFAYTYDNVRNVDTLVDSDGLHDYDYDGVNRLIQALHPEDIGIAGRESFTYDSNGNRLTAIDAEGRTTTFSYDLSGRITSARNPSGNITIYGHDADGNMISRSDGASFTYDFINRLTRYTQGNTTAHYVYDPFGRRIKKTVNDITTWYLWDGDVLLAEYDVSGARSKRYVYMPGDFLPVQMEDASGIYNVHGDHLQTPRLLTDSAQQVIWRARYETFGQPTVDEDVDNNGTSVSFNFRFSGQYADAESGLYYNWYRYYDPKIGRYITRDPIGLSGGLNKYAYVENNPLNFMDPFGLRSGGSGGSGGRSSFNPRPPGGNPYSPTGRYGGSWVYGKWYPRLGDSYRPPRYSEPTRRSPLRPQTDRALEKILRDLRNQGITDDLLQDMGQRAPDPSLAPPWNDFPPNELKDDRRYFPPDELEDQNDEGWDDTGSECSITEPLVGASPAI